MNEKIKEIAEFDGWELIGEPEYKPPFKCYHKDIKVIPVINPQGSEYVDWAMSMPYLTDLNALHRVALDVMDAMTELFNTTMDGDVFMPASDLEYNIKRSCYIRPINGQYTYLVDAVYEAIVYLKKHNLCQPK